MAGIKAQQEQNLTRFSAARRVSAKDGGHKSAAGAKLNALQRGPKGARQGWRA